MNRARSPSFRNSFSPPIRYPVRKFQLATKPVQSTQAHKSSRLISACSLYRATVPSYCTTSPPVTARKNIYTHHLHFEIILYNSQHPTKLVLFHSARPPRFHRLRRFRFIPSQMKKNFYSVHQPLQFSRRLQQAPPNRSISKQAKRTAIQIPYAFNVTSSHDFAQVHFSPSTSTSPPKSFYIQASKAYGASFSLRFNMQLPLRIFAESPHLVANNKAPPNRSITQQAKSTALHSPLGLTCNFLFEISQSSHLTFKTTSTPKSFHIQASKAYEDSFPVGFQWNFRKKKNFFPPFTHPPKSFYKFPHRPLPHHMPPQIVLYRQHNFFVAT